MAPITTVAREDIRTEEPGGAGRADTLRILHVLAPATFGGLEQVVLALAAGQAGAGHDVHVALIVEPQDAEHPLLTSLGEKGVQGYALVLPPRAYQAERNLVRELCVTIAPDVVHTHGARCDVLHGPVARRLRIPTVATSHGFTGGDWKNRLYEYLQQRSFRKYQAVVAVSRPMVERIARGGVRQDRLHCVPNAWAGGVTFLSREAARAELDIPADAFCVGFIGRLTHEKGPDVFVDAVAAAGTPVMGIMVGDGAMRPQLEARALTHNLAGRVRWAGTVPNAARVIRAFDAVALSSRTEGTPVVLLEAMAAQVPVIATTVGGIPHVVSHREALLVPSENAGSIGAAMRAVLEDAEAAALRATHAAERLASERSPEQWLEQYDRVYRACGAFAAGSGSTR